MANTAKLVPQFISSTQGKLFCLLYQPAVPVSGSVVLLLPPFAEEMNKSRRQISMQAQRFCALGYPVMVFDFYGTGDSEGSFGEASFSLWQENLDDVLTWLAQQGYTNCIPWAIRFGALFVEQVLQNSQLPASHLILWQPITSGQQAMGQFLRLKTAASMLSNTSSVSAADMKAELEAGNSIEVAGYEVSPDLYKESVTRKLEFSPGALQCPVDWFQVLSGTQTSLPPVVNKLVESWQLENNPVRTHAIKGDSFWAATELVVIPELVEQTTRALDTNILSTGESDNAQ